MRRMTGNSFRVLATHHPLAVHPCRVSLMSIPLTLLDTHSANNPLLAMIVTEPREHEQDYSYLSYQRHVSPLVDSLLPSSSPATLLTSTHPASAVLSKLSFKRAFPSPC